MSNDRGTSIFSFDPVSSRFMLEHLDPMRFTPLNKVMMHCKISSGVFNVDSARTSRAIYYDDENMSFNSYCGLVNSMSTHIDRRSTRAKGRFL